MAETTLDGLAASVARRYGYYVSGTATSGSITTLVDATNLIQQDNAWNNMVLRVGSGANAGKERLITSFAAGTLTFAALAGAIVAGVTYEVGALQRNDVMLGIHEAIDRAGETWMRVVDTSTGLAFQPGTQEYALPADCSALLGVYITRTISGSQVTEWEPIEEFSVVGVPGARKLLMRGWITEPVNNQLSYGRRIRYLAVPTLLAASADTLGLGEIAERKASAFITEYALGVLHKMAFTRDITGEQARGHLTAGSDAMNHAMMIMQEREVRREKRQMTGLRWGRQI